MQLLALCMLVSENSLMQQDEMTGSCDKSLKSVARVYDRNLILPCLNWGSPKCNKNVALCLRCPSKTTETKRFGHLANNIYTRIFGHSQLTTREWMSSISHCYRYEVIRPHTKHDKKRLAHKKFSSFDWTPQWNTQFSPFFCLCVGKKLRVSSCVATLL